jgi:hypothetical protein
LDVPSRRCVDPAAHPPRLSMAVGRPAPEPHGGSVAANRGSDSMVSMSRISSALLGIIRYPFVRAGDPTTVMKILHLELIRLGYSAHQGEADKGASRGLAHHLDDHPWSYCRRDRPVDRAW